MCIEIQYLPPIAFWSAWKEYGHITIEQKEHYIKGSYRNRCHIAGANGLLRLSIPLKKGKHQQTPIREVRISYEEDWQKQHWQSILSAYGKAPFFEYYVDTILPFYERKYIFLFDFNLKLIEALRNEINGSLTYALNKEYVPKSNDDPKDMRDVIVPKEFHDTPRYPQVFEEKHGFLSNLSILDMLFCVGPEVDLMI